MEKKRNVSILEVVRNSLLYRASFRALARLEWAASSFRAWAITRSFGPLLRKSHARAGGVGRWRLSDWSAANIGAF